MLERFWRVKPEKAEGSVDRPDRLIDFSKLSTRNASEDLSLREQVCVVHIAECFSCLDQQ